MPLQFAAGYTSLIGPRERNEDYCGMVTPEGAELEIKGALFAVADGVSGNEGGREAAEYSVRGLLADYYATPDTWSVTQALDKVLNANNRWLLAQGAARPQLRGMATTLTGLVLRGGRYFIAHIGDSRAYLLRGGRLSALTTDHVWDRPDMQHVLTRALGLDPHLLMDYADGELAAGDTFLLCCDGVWEPLGDQRLRELLQAQPDPASAAAALTAAALQAGGQDNVSAVVVRVDEVPSGNWRDSLAAGRRLVVPPRLRPGQQLDDFTIDALLHESRATLLYRARQQQTGQLVALKTLQPLLAADEVSCEGLLAEEWLAKRVVSPYFPQVIPLPTDKRSRLYYAMSYHDGASLQQKLDAGGHFSAAEVAQIGTRVTKGLAALHRLHVVHRDIKPANLHWGDDGELRILDLGVALAAGVPYPEMQGNPGTPSFMAPELFEGAPADAQTDLYALGASLYHLLTRKYPYGEVEPFQHPKFGEPVPPARFRPDIPAWLENLILKAVARDRRRRFETAEELLLALERGDSHPLAAPARTPMVERAPNLVWQSIALIAIVLNLILLYLLLLK